MAAVTLVARGYKVNVAGAHTQKRWKITGVSTNTLDTGIKSGRQITPLVEPSTITAIAQSTVNGQIRLTFTSTGAFTGVTLLVDIVG